MSSKSNSTSTSTSNIITSTNKIWPATSPELQGVIEYICKNHGVDIYRNFAGLTLKNTGCSLLPLCLSIANISSTRNIYGSITGKISLTHYYALPTGDGGDGERPVIEMMFYFVRDTTTNCAICTPFEVEITEDATEEQQLAAGYSFECSAWVVSGSSKHLTPDIIRQQAELSELARKWAIKLTDQGFTTPPCHCQCPKTIERSRGSEPQAERRN